MDGDLVRELIDLVKETSPLVWEIARRQVVVEAYAHLPNALFEAAIAVVVFLAGRWCWNKSQEFEHDPDAMGFGILTIMCAVLFLGMIGFAGADIVDFGKMLANPDYYAIHQILSFVK